MPKRLGSPIQWFGGKGNMVAKIAPLLPPHVTYVEPFAGGASLFFAKRPARVEVLNDVHSGIVTLFRVLRDPEQFERFRRLVEATPYSREEFGLCSEAWAGEPEPVLRAWAFFVSARQAFSGHAGGSWGYNVASSTGGHARMVSAWLAACEGLPAVHQRLREAQIEHGDFRKVWTAFDTAATLYYVDPPYVLGTRSGGTYDSELSDRDHEDLVDLCLGAKGRIILSGYANPVYAPLEAARWKRIDWQVSCNAAGRTKASGLKGAGAATDAQARTESVWISPNLRELWGLSL